jgi:hypothetical protein
MVVDCTTQGRTFGGEVGNVRGIFNERRCGQGRAGMAEVTVWEDAMAPRSCLSRSGK